MNKFKVIIDVDTEWSEEVFFNKFKQLLKEQLREFTLEVGEHKFTRIWEQSGKKVETLKEKKNEEQKSI